MGGIVGGGAHGQSIRNFAGDSILHRSHIFHAWGGGRMVREHDDDDAIAKARVIVMKYGWNSSAYQILNKGMCLWFSKTTEAVIGYQDFGRYRIVAGAPVCALTDVAAVIEELKEETAKLHKNICYFCAGTRLASFLRTEDSGNSILLGAEPVWHPQEWAERIQEKPSLRAQVARAVNKGVHVNAWDNDRAAKDPMLQKCLEDWLSTRGLPPLHFLIESQTLDRLLDRRLYVAERDGMPIGFVTLAPIPNRNGWLVEQNIRGASAPNGTIELLLTHAASDVAAMGAEFFTLGLSPLSRQYSSPSTGRDVWWLKGILAWLRAHGTRFYNFGGLDAFKSKFRPAYWEPIYALTTEDTISLPTLYAIAGAFAGMSPVRLVAHALFRAAVRELGRGR